MMTAIATVTVMTDDEVRRLGARDNASFGALETARGPLPLVAMSVDARITGLLAALELEQTFVNPTSEPIEATYIFPLPDRAAVTRFRMEVAGRVVEGVVEERGAARQQYDQAIAKGHRAAIAEEDRAGVFTLRVGNLLPREAATVKLTLTGPLPLDDNEVTFRFPLVVAPRYIPGHALAGPQAGTGWAPDTDAVPDASRITPPVLLPNCPNPVRLAIRAAIDPGGVPISALASSLHAVTEASRAGVTVVEIRPNAERLDRDFILRWRIGDAQVHSALAVADDADGQGGTFSVTIVPPTEGVTQRPRDVVFVLDRSGSMEGWKMIAARRAVARMIDSLGARDRFSVLAFDDSIETPSNLSGLIEATDRNRFRAVEFLAGIGSRGGTEMARPLAMAADMLAGGYDDRDRVLVLATDGQVGNEDQILRELSARLRNVRVFTLGIDQAVNAAFLRRLAAAGGGACELVESEDRLDQVMDKVHRRIATPVAIELGIGGEGLAIDSSSVTPRRMPDLFVGAPIVVSGRYRGRAPERASIVVFGRLVAGGALRETLARPAVKTGTDAAAITAVWARGRIRDLEDQYATAPAPSLEREIVGVSKRFSVLSRFTAFLAVDRTEVVNPGGELRTITQPVEMPAGWEMQREGMARSRSAPPAPMAMSPMPAMNAPMGMPPVTARSMAAYDDLDEECAAPGAPMEAYEAASIPPPMQAPRRPAPAAAGGAPPSPPAKSRPKPPPSPGFASRVSRHEKEAERKVAAPAMPDAPYRARLADLARMLEAAQQGTPEELAAVIAHAAFRLSEWIEDAQSVGLAALVAEVKPCLDDLTAALTDANARRTTAADVIRRLREIADGGAPGGAPRPGRVAFWK